MNILVTGCNGFIGRVLCKELAKANYRVYGIDRRAAVNPYLVCENIIDLAHIDLYRYLVDNRIDAVMHLAASHEVERSVRDPGAFFENNVSNSITLLNACIRARVKNFIFSSTGSIYDMSTGVGNPPDNPQNPYAASKLAVEQLLKYYSAAHEISICSLRYFNAAGADVDGESGYTQTPATHLIPILAKKILDREPLAVFGNDYPTTDGTAIRDYVHVADIARAHLATLDQYSDQPGYTQIDIGTGTGHSILDVISAAQESLGVGIDVEIKPRRAGDPAEVWLANTPQLDWQPKYSLHDMIVSAVNWERTRRKLDD